MKGAVITFQDGIHVKYRKKCTVCGYEDHFLNTVPIRNGVTTVSFYCRKCRKPRRVEIQGSTD